MIYQKLKDKVILLKKEGKSDDQVKKESIAYLKSILRDAPFEDRRKFFLSEKRITKLKILLGND